MEKLELIEKLSDIISILAADYITPKDAINDKLWEIWEGEQVWTTKETKDK